MKFSGRLADFSLPDILRILVQNPKSGALQLNLKGQEGAIYIHQGELYHAEYEDVVGEKAVFQLFTFDSDAEFEFVEAEPLQSKTIESPLDVLIQSGTAYVESWRKAAKKFPHLSGNATIYFEKEDGDVSAFGAEVLALLASKKSMSLSALSGALEVDAMTLSEELASLENQGMVQILSEESVELKRFFIEMANTLYAEFESISGMKLKQETLARLQKLIQENNWKIDLQNGRIVGDKIRIDTMDEQKKIFGQYLRHLIDMIVPIYGASFIQQVMDKVEKHLTRPIHHWVDELSLKV